jgi:uncharacterized protein (DUF58 family)
MNASRTTLFFQKTVAPLPGFDLLERSATLHFLRGWWRERLTPGGRWLFIASGLFFGYGSTSLELQTMVPLLYLLALWGIAFCTLWIERPRARLKARHAMRIRAGENLPVECEIEARGGAAHDWWIFPHRLPAGLEVLPPHGAPLPDLQRGAKTTALLQLRAPRRGHFALQGWRVETDFPFGLLVAARTFKQTSTLLVHPRFTPLERLGLPVGRRYHPGGVALVASHGESLEYIGNRDWREGDEPRHIDWRATARLQTPIVREYREEYFLRAAVVLDTFVAEAKGEETFERAVSLCASVAEYMAREDYLVDLFAAGPNLYHLTAGRGLAYLEQILDILACVEASHDEPFEMLEPEIEQHLAQINTVICVFLDWTQARHAFVARLALQGAAIKVLVARDTPCSLDPKGERFEVALIPRTRFESGVTEL